MNAYRYRGKPDGCEVRDAHLEKNGTPLWHFLENVLRFSADLLQPFSAMLKASVLCMTVAVVAGFHPPHIQRLNAADAPAALNRMPGEHFVAVLDEHTQIKMRKFSSSRFVTSGEVVQCLSLSNIEVAPQQRRQGHARRALRALRKAADVNRHVLIVENVVSDHMHALIESLQGDPLPGCRRGAKGCNYVLPPPRRNFKFEEYAQA